MNKDTSSIYERNDRKKQKEFIKYLKEEYGMFWMLWLSLLLLSTWPFIGYPAKFMMDWKIQKDFKRFMKEEGITVEELEPARDSENDSPPTTK